MGSVRFFFFFFYAAHFCNSSHAQTKLGSAGCKGACAPVTGWDRHSDAEIDTKLSCLGNYTLPAFSPQSAFQRLSHKGRYNDKWDLLLKIPVLKRTSLLAWHSLCVCLFILSSRDNLLLQKCIAAPPSAGTKPLLLAPLEMIY